MECARPEVGFQGAQCALVTELHECCPLWCKVLGSLEESCIGFIAARWARVAGWPVARVVGDGGAGGVSRGDISVRRKCGAPGGDPPCLVLDRGVTHFEGGGGCSTAIISARLGIPPPSLRHHSALG